MQQQRCVCQHSTDLQHHTAPHSPTGPAAALMSPLVNLPLQIYLHIALKVIHDKKKKKRLILKLKAILLSIANTKIKRLLIQYIR